MTIEEMIKREHDEVERLENHQRELLSEMEVTTLGPQWNTIISGIESSYMMLRTAKNQLTVLGETISKKTGGIKLSDAAAAVVDAGTSAE